MSLESQNHFTGNTLQNRFVIFCGAVQLLTLIQLSSCAPDKKVETVSSSTPSNGVSPSDTDPPSFLGSTSCRPCHEKFYQLWESSFHGKAMQPYTKKFAQRHLSFDNRPIPVGKSSFVAAESGDILEITHPSGRTHRYPIAQVMGGKYMYYFLTPFPRGRLQLLPIAYDVTAREWFPILDGDVHTNIASPQNTIHWKDPLYTFNTSCHRCHVSQLQSNYDPHTDTYQTTWREPGINCETCHGPAEAHNQVCERAGQTGAVPRDLKIIRGGRDFSVRQNNHSCLSCHSKLTPITTDYLPGQNIFDHFDFVLLESDDYFADGRDKKENYTFTSWALSPCAKNEKLACGHCHTSSGRFKQRDAANQSCVPCHTNKLEQLSAHSHHPDSPGAPGCIDCHMPTTPFAKQMRTDHSMRPPAPSATIAFGSPNACNLCHMKKTAQWADKQVRAWHGNSRSDASLLPGKQIQAARAQDWRQLDDLLQWMVNHPENEIIIASLLRMLQFNTNPKILPVIQQAAAADTPLVRASAMQALRQRNDDVTTELLTNALTDSSRLVRIRAVQALIHRPRFSVPSHKQKAWTIALKEYITSLTSRPDHPESLLELGNYYLTAHSYPQAVEAFTTATRFRPANADIWVNLALAQYRLGMHNSAKQSLAQALVLNPKNEAAVLNMAMLQGELGNTDEAIRFFTIALKNNPDCARAAHNLCILHADKNWQIAKSMCTKAVQIDADQPQYQYTFAYYLSQHHDTERAVIVLRNLIQHTPAYSDAVTLLKKLQQDAAKPK